MTIIEGMIIYFLSLKFICDEDGDNVSIHSSNQSIQWKEVKRLERYLFDYQIIFLNLSREISRKY